MTDDVIEVVSALFVLAGALLTLSSAIGLVRFRDTLSRMHPAAKPQVLGLLLVLLGAGVRIYPSIDLGMLVLAAIVAVSTAPVIANRVGNLAYRESVEDGTITHEAPVLEKFQASEANRRKRR
ncbi:monovalent cation/H(+) antiporter subunit G [Dietzia sp. UBA5065]|jgi:multicomponent Na+:H+ antiporter subunit G|uniref:monovalent cation/H(+) antiporter subunit G n=1 Tax=Dietzia sp. UBA5065 TaxID=1946422 RepID=UPI0025C587CC|nr:monovalent cation/H(+) antiporter subunit G [Dietzia sp. UBA5065]HMT49795.1 monovalent cation/H(+) antiporter subunit G [Dietzia sp.]